MDRSLSARALRAVDVVVCRYQMDLRGNAHILFDANASAVVEAAVLIDDRIFSDRAIAARVKPSIHKNIAVFSDFIIHDPPVETQTNSVGRKFGHQPVANEK